MILLPKKLVLLITTVLVVAIGLIVYVINRPQDVRQRANDATPQSIPACIVSQARCLWDSLDNTTQYQVTITDVSSGTEVRSGVVNHPETSFVFPAEAGKQYQCTVTPLNSCGTGESVSITGETCPANQVTPTPSVTVTPEPTSVVPTVIPPTGTGTPPTDVPQATATPAPTTTDAPQPTSTPQPTSVVYNTPVPTEHIGSVEPFITPTPTPLQALPSTGIADTVVQMTILGSFLALLGAAVFIFLW